MILLYTLNLKKEKAIVSLCRAMGLEVRKLKPSDVNCQVGALAEGKRVLKKNPEVKPDSEYKLTEIMIFSGLTDEKLDMFLKEYRESGIESIPLKAVITASNMSWTLYELAVELKREHAALNVSRR